MNYRKAGLQKRHSRLKGAQNEHCRGCIAPTAVLVGSFLSPLFYTSLSKRVNFLTREVLFFVDNMVSVTVKQHYSASDRSSLPTSITVLFIGVVLL